MKETKPTASSKNGDALPFLVGIGASAGGLDALERVFRNMPVNLGAAFVVIQHLSPDHPSMMAELMSRYTKMPVKMVADDCDIEPDHVYLIAPGQVLKVQGTRLLVSSRPQHGAVQVVDSYFATLAEEYGPKSIAVILSGTGSDGSRGASRIIDVGGAVIVQAPSDARFDGMPRSVIASDAVTDIAPAEEIGLRIQARIKGPLKPLIQRDAQDEQNDDSLQADAAYTQLIEALREYSGINFEDYKSGTILRRIEKRMAAQKVSSLQNYLRFIRRNPEEIQDIISDVTISVTKFFRDGDAFNALATRAVDSIIMNNGVHRPIRVWVAGVATGEEVYSIEMLFLEAFDRLGVWPQLKMFATDIDQAGLDIASLGQYPASIEEDVSPERLARFFVRKEDGYVIRPDLRQRVVFARHNLLSDPPFTKMDLVTCRNTLIYFRSAAQERAMRKLHYALNQNGYLFLGQSESLGDEKTSFTVIDSRSKLFRAETPAPRLMDIDTHVGSATVHRAPSVGPREKTNRQRLVEAGAEALLNAFSPPPAILVNSAREVLHVFGSAHKFLRFPEGDVTLQLDRILNPALLPITSALLHRSAREHERVSSTPISLKQDSEETKTKVQIHVIPVNDVNNMKLFMVVFAPEIGQSAEISGELIDLDMAAGERVSALETELAGLRENLQMTIEELEASNEEMQATNEELMASNEELQSTNEELQSVNEELNTVNAEFVEKVESLNRSNSELDNLLDVANASAVFLNEDLSILRYSEEALKMFRLRTSDIGRPIQDIRHNFEYSELHEDLMTAIDRQVEIDRTVKLGSGAQFLLRIKPFRITASYRLGVIISFTDLSPNADGVSPVPQFFHSISTPNALMRMDGTLMQANAAWNTAIKQVGSVFDGCIMGTDGDNLRKLLADFQGPKPQEEKAAEMLAKIKKLIRKSAGEEVIFLSSPKEAMHSPQFVTIQRINDPERLLSISCFGRNTKPQKG